MGHGVATGHFTAAPYFQSIGSAANPICPARLRARFGDGCVTNLCWEAAYFQMHIFANAYRQAGRDGIAEILPHILGSELAAPQGRVKIDPSNHNPCLYPRVGRVAAHAGYPAPYLGTHSLGDWTARLDTLEARDEPCPDEGAQACLGAARREV